MSRLLVANHPATIRKQIKIAATAKVLKDEVKEKPKPIRRSVWALFFVIRSYQGSEIDNSLEFCLVTYIMVS